MPLYNVAYVQKGMEFIMSKGLKVLFEKSYS